MYSLPVFNDDVNIARKKFLITIDNIIDGVINKKLAQSYEKGYVTYVPVDIRRFIREYRFTNQEQNAFKDLILTTSFQLESQQNGSSFIFFNALIEFLKLPNTSIINNDILKTLQPIFQFSRRAKINDYETYVHWNIQDDLVLHILKEVIKLTGNTGSIFLEKKPANETYIEHTEGYTYPLLVSDIFLESVNLSQWKNHDVKIAIIDGMIERVSEIHGLLENLSNPLQPTIFFARGYSNDVSSTLAMNKLRGTLDVIPIEVPYSSEGANLLKDIAVITGIDVRSSLKGELISTMNIEDLGTLKNVTIEKGKVTIEDEKNRRCVKAHANNLKKQLTEIDDVNNKIAMEKTRLLLLRIKSLSSFCTTIALSKTLGEHHGIALDRLAIGIGMLRDVCSMGVVDISKINLKDKSLQKSEYVYMKNLIRRFKKMNISLYGTGALFHGIRGALSLALEIKNSSVMIQMDHNK